MKSVSYVTSHVAMNQLVYIESCVRKIQKEKAQKEKLVPEGHNVDSNGGKSAAESKYPELQASGMLALCRLMIIDANFCEANLQLLFTVVESAPSETVRSNCTIALGDLAVRFPNLLEPWTENMYARLHDPSLSVRKNAVLVLSHLILNDMMKVKGHINEMAMRLEDEDERISNLAKLFFHELSKKGNNPIYNLLPDILGKLSNQDLKQESFFNIMQFLIGSIKKDKQMEALVEKLCYRFSGVTDARQWENISYCLAQLSFTDKGIKKLIELFKTYEHVLSNEVVMEHFRSIISKGKKFAKPELKSCIEEFEGKISQFHIDKKEQELTARNAAAHQQKADAIKNITMDTNIEEKSIVSESAEGEVMDPSTDKESDVSSNEHSKPVESEDCSEASSQVTPVESEDCSQASSQVIQSEPCDDEVLSPLVVPKGTAKTRSKKTTIKPEKTESHAPSTRVTRSRRR